MLEELDVDEGIGLGDAYARHEVADRRGGVSPPAQAREGGHPRIVPAGDVAFLHEPEEPALRKHEVRNIEAGELDLPRGKDLGLADEPFVQGPMDLVLEGAQRVRHALYRVGQRMLEIVHGIDAPGRARCGNGARGGCGT